MKNKTLRNLAIGLTALVLISVGAIQLAQKLEDKQGFIEGAIVSTTTIPVTKYTPSNTERAEGVTPIYLPKDDTRSAETTLQMLANIGGKSTTEYLVASCKQKMRDDAAANGEDVPSEEDQEACCAVTGEASHIVTTTAISPASEISLGVDTYAGTATLRHAAAPQNHNLNKILTGSLEDEHTEALKQAKAILSGATKEAMAKKLGSLQYKFARLATEMSLEPTVYASLPEKCADGSVQALIDEYTIPGTELSVTTKVTFCEHTNNRDRIGIGMEFYDKDTGTPVFNRRGRNFVFFWEAADLEGITDTVDQETLTVLKNTLGGKNGGLVGTIFKNVTNTFNDIATKAPPAEIITEEDWIDGLLEAYHRRVGYGAGTGITVAFNPKKIPCPEPPGGYGVEVDIENEGALGLGYNDDRRLLLCPDGKLYDIPNTEPVSSSPPPNFPGPNDPPPPLAETDPDEWGEKEVIL